jgi:hypothetical protein
MADERPEAAYAARLLERQDALQAEANRLVEQLDLPSMLGRAGRFERLGSSVSGLMVWRDLDLGVSCGVLSPERAWETIMPLSAQPRTTRLHYSNETGRLASPELRGYGRYYFVVYHQTEAGEEWKIDISLWSPGSPPGPLAHAEELRGRLTDRLANPATYGCRKDDRKCAVERLLDGVRVGEEDLLQHVRAACRPGRVVLEP